MKYILEYKDSDGINRTEFTSIEERRKFIMFHNSLPESFEVIMEYDIKFEDITPIVATKESIIVLCKLAGFKTEMFQVKNSKDAFKGSNFSFSLNDRYLYRIIGTRFLFCELGVFEYNTKEKCYNLKVVFVKEPSEESLDYFVVDHEGQHLIRKFKPEFTIKAGPSTFSGCQAILDYIKLKPERCRHKPSPFQT